MKSRSLSVHLSLLVFAFFTFPLLLETPALATVYYVSSSMGNDDNTGQTPDDPFETIDKINNLSLSPGDEVRFFCGDTWQGEMLILTHSGTTESPIIISSYPSGCSNKPVLSGSLPISGWTGHSANIFRADLSSGSNAGHFPDGINQLFRNGQRIRLGRWPNIEGHPDGGYASVDYHAPGSDQFTDSELPDINWTGAAVHMKGIRWYIMNREVLNDSNDTLTLNDVISCYTGNCSEWGYFINSHLATLDQENEWYYDEATNSVYLFSSQAPADGELEGSVILDGDGHYLGGIILGDNLWEHITDVVVENFEVKNWFANGINFPVNFELDDPERIVIRNNIIRDVNESGIKLSTWVWNAGDDSGWRGGEDLLVESNLIDGANVYGIDCFTSSSTFIGNTIRNIALIENLNRDGMGCGFTGTSCTEVGAGFRLKVQDPLFSGHDNVIMYNTIDRVGMQGFDIFGPGNTLRFNYIDEACYSKGDCGGIRTFGGSSFSSTSATDITISDNIITNTIGNTDGCHPDFDPLFGFGIYVDHYSDDIVVDNNTVLNCTVAGILIQNSRAEVTNSVMHNNANATMTTGQFVLAGNAAEVSFTNNIMYSLSDNQRTMAVRDASNFTVSDDNYFFNPYRDRSIMVQQTGYQTYTLDEWQSYSGLDMNSHEHWFNLGAGEDPRSIVYYNPYGNTLAINPGLTIYEDLDRNTVSGWIYLEPFESIILVDTGQELEPVPAANPLILMIAFSFTILNLQRVNRYKRQ